MHVDLRKIAQFQRYATKQLIKDLVKNYNPQVEKNIFKSADNVTIDMILGYKKKGKHYSYLDTYDKDEDNENKF